MITGGRAKPSLLLNILTSLWLGVAAALVLLLALHLTVSFIYLGRVFPGVSMRGLPLGGEKLDGAAANIAASYNYPQTGQIQLTDGVKTWVVRPSELGIYLDPAASARNAYEVGRKGSLLDLLGKRFALWRGGVDVPPTFVYNESIGLNFLLRLSAEINQPIREASLSISGTEVTVVNGQPGRVLDLQASLAAITQQVELMQDGTVPLVVVESQPEVLDASAQGQLVQTILSKPLRLTIPAEAGGTGQEWKLPADSLARMLTFDKVANGSGVELQVVVNSSLMNSYLESLRDETDLAPENSRFIFNDDTRQLDLLTPAVIGRTLDTAKSVEAISAILNQGGHSASLAFTLTEPAVTDKMTGAQLGITELVYAYTSYFRGSIPERVQNIVTASSRFHGLLVPPGATLSMSDVLGNISLDNGYAEALIILGDETIKGVGGGVCQVSTTLFRTVYYSGYQIVERHPHAYRVGYYEQTGNGGHDTRLAGLDAAVFVPLVDFKFANDTNNWLLMETYVNKSNYSLTWKFYSTSDGRSVESRTTGLTDIVEAPKPLYRENPELSKGEIRQIDWAVEGASVVVTRTVTRNGEVLYVDRIVTQYQPWRDIYEYGPGTELPKEE